MMQVPRPGPDCQVKSTFVLGGFLRSLAFALLCMHVPAYDEPELRTQHRDQFTLVLRDGSLGLWGTKPHRHSVF